MTAQLDHLVIAASTLDEGVAWCEQTLGITPGAGGEHPLFGTHNRLFSIASDLYPKAYFEIIAINPRAVSEVKTRAKRWFDLDNADLQLQLKQNGPQLIHCVASTPAVHAAVSALGQLGIDRGEVVKASRMTAHGLLSWQITVRTDGERLMNGTLPTLIEWGDVHPTQHMAASGITLQSLTACQTEPSRLRAANSAIGLRGLNIVAGRPNLLATLQTPRGVVTLESKGI